MEFKKITHTSLYEDVMEQLENYIEYNTLNPGDRLPTERDMSEKLGISRGTLREAYRILEANGIVEVTPGGGRYLKKDLKQTNLIFDILNDFETTDAMDLMELRELLELKIIELVIDKAKEEEINEIEANLDLGNNLYECDNLFHLSLAKASKNTAFYKTMEFNLNLLAKIRIKSLLNEERSMKMPIEHAELMKAIKKKDKDKAKEIMIEHLKHVKESIRQETSGNQEV